MQIHRVRAFVSLTAFVNALVVSLFALIGDNLAAAVEAVAVVGLVRALVSLISVLRPRGLHGRDLPDELFLIGPVAAFGLQFVGAIRLARSPQDAAAAEALATLAVIFFLTGILRARELIGAFAGDLARALQHHPRSPAWPLRRRLSATASRMSDVDARRASVRAPPPHGAMCSTRRLAAARCCPRLPRSRRLRLRSKVIRRTSGSLAVASSHSESASSDAARSSHCHSLPARSTSF